MSCIGIVLEMGPFPQGPIIKSKLGYKLSKQRTQLKIAPGTNPNFLSKIVLRAQEFLR